MVQDVWFTDESKYCTAAYHVLPWWLLRRGTGDAAPVTPTWTVTMLDYGQQEDRLFSSSAHFVTIPNQPLFLFSAVQFTHGSS